MWMEERSVWFYKILRGWRARWNGKEKTFMFISYFSYYLYLWSLLLSFYSSHWCIHTIQNRTKMTSKICWKIFKNKIYNSNYVHGITETSQRRSKFRCRRVRWTWAKFKFNISSRWTFNDCDGSCLLVLVTCTRKMCQKRANLSKSSIFFSLLVIAMALRHPTECGAERWAMMCSAKKKGQRRRDSFCK